jgi:nucleotide-binding universal stress UspA family protein
MQCRNAGTNRRLIMADSAPIDRSYRRILAWVELDQSGEAVARRALHMARMTRSRLVLFHAIQPDLNVADGYPAPSRESLKQHFESAAVARLTQLANRLGAAEAECQASYGAPAQAFSAYAEQWTPDLVVVSTNDTRYISDGRWDVLSLQGTTHSKRGHFARLFDWALT